MPFGERILTVDWRSRPQRAHDIGWTSRSTDPFLPMRDLNTAINLHDPYLDALRPCEVGPRGAPKPKYPPAAHGLELDWSFETGAIQFITGFTSGAKGPSSAANSSRVKTRICTSLSGRATSELARKAAKAFSQGTDLVEFRIDLLRSPRLGEIRADLSKFMSRSVVTVRPVPEGGGFEGDETERLGLLRGLAQLKPAYLDVELRAIEASPDGIPLGPGSIVSWHDTQGTGDRRELLSVMKRAASYRGLVKIVTTATVPADNLTVLSLYDGKSPAPIAFCMGARGILSRVMAMERGCPIAYASLEDEPTASGQLPLGLALAVRRCIGGA